MILAHAFFPGEARGGDVHFDDDEMWTSRSKEGATALSCLYILPKKMIPGNHSSYLFPCNTYVGGHLVEDEKASHPRLFLNASVMFFRIAVNPRNILPVMLKCSQYKTSLFK